MAKYQQTMGLRTLLKEMPLSYAYNRSDALREQLRKKDEEALRQQIKDVERTIAEQQTKIAEKERQLADTNPLTDVWTDFARDVLGVPGQKSLEIESDLRSLRGSLAGWKARLQTLREEHERKSFKKPSPSRAVPMPTVGPDGRVQRKQMWEQSDDPGPQSMPYVAKPGEGPQPISSTFWVNR